MPIGTKAGIVKVFFWAIIVIILGGLAWIRLAPSDPAVWHVDPKVTADQDLAGGVRRRIAGGPDGTFVPSWTRTILATTPRTEVLAGSAGGRDGDLCDAVAMDGFPDYTTVMKNDDVLELFARLRFGQSDMGVNKARVESWLDRLEAERD